MRRISALLESSVRTREGIVASALPVPLAGGAIGGWRGLMNGLFGLNGRLRVYLEEYRGQLRSTAFVYDGRRPEWVVLMLAALPEPGGAYDPPHLIGGNPLAMRRRMALIEHDQTQPSAVALAFAGMDRHPNVLKVRTDAGDVDKARDLVRAAVRVLPAGRAITSPVRSYEEHVARALLSEGFRDAATSMLFVKELAVRVEEPALAPAVVR